MGGSGNEKLELLYHSSLIMHHFYKPIEMLKVSLQRQLCGSQCRSYHCQQYEIRKGSIEI